VKGRVLVAGFATRHVAQSASRAGYEVCAVDHFCDQDLFWCTKDREKFEDLEDLPGAIARICARHRFDLFVPTSGAETLPVPVPACGTPRDTLARFLDKLDTQHFFETLDIPAPRLLPEGEYPAMVKPRSGAGGWRNAVVGSRAEMAVWRTMYADIPHIRQELVSGTAASVCCLATGSRAMAVTTNEQILRGSGESAFGFSGSITPFDPIQRREMIALAGRIAAASGCCGTIGIDFVVGDDRLAVIEVNPRFQGTVDTVEMATGCNIFSLHIDACSGRLPAQPLPIRQVAARSILFSDRDLTLRNDLAGLGDFVADIPWPGTFFEEGQAIVSVIGRGPTRDAALAMLDKHITTVRQYMR
jgi:uncharacterized protein